jgi:cyclase
MGLKQSILNTALAVGFMFTGALALASENFTATPLADHLQLVSGPSGNTLVAEDTDGLILVEGVPAEYAEEYLGFVRELTGQSNIKLLIHTHWHPDSAGLNQAMGDAGVEIVAHANTRQWLGAVIRKRGEVIAHTPLRGDALPKTWFYTDYSVPFREGSIELGYLLQAHTDGDIYVHFPQQQVLFTGDVVLSDGWSTVDETTNGFIGGLSDAYDTLAALVEDQTRIVPGSGPLMDKADFEAQKTLYQGLATEMVTLFRKALSAEEAVAANPADGLQPAWGDPAEFVRQGHRSFYGHLRDSRHVGTMY